jgi:ABC-type glycerol-3-phosphate transport system substrate-binding protein
VLGALAAAAGAAVGAGLWGPRALGAARGSAPTAAAAVAEITFAPNWQGAPWNKTAQTLSQQLIDGQFTAKHPGSAVRVVASTQGQASAQIAATIAGTGYVDVFNDCCTDLPIWVASGMMMPLNSLLKQANVDLSQWSALRVQGLNFFGQQYALPAYDGPEVMVYRQDLMDSFGLSYPEPGWDYQAAAKLWAQAARTVNGKRVYGVSLDNYDVNVDYLLHGWGGSLFNADHTRCLLDSPEAIAAGNWMFGLMWDGVASPSRDQVGGLTSGQDVFSVCGGWNTFTEATQLGTKFKWGILPQPTWAQRKATMVNSDFYAINAHTKQPELAWEFFHWLTADPTWTRFVMGATLTQPALVALWDEWITLAEQVAPPLKGKGLQYYREAALGGYEVPQSFFLYNGTQATGILNAAWADLTAQRATVTAAFTQAAQQINALEQTAQANLAVQAAEAKAFPTVGPAMAAMPTGI